MSSTEWAFVSGIVEVLGERANQDGIESLTLDGRVVLLSVWASGIIGNGGFGYFYEGATETLEIAAAFDALGLHDAADACRTAHVLVPTEVLSGGFEACRNWMDALDKAGLDALFDPPNEAIWGVEDRLGTALAAYIRAHALTSAS